MKKITKLATTALLTVGAMATSYAQGNQQNIGAKCGCPAVNVRPTANISIKGTTNARGVSEFVGNVRLSCDTLWELNGQFYMPSPYTLTIDPGTVIQGIYNADPLFTGALFIERGAKINAAGTKDCGIILTTNQDNLDGTYSLTNVSKWGGIAIAGIAGNNLTQLANSAAGKLAAGTGADGVGNAEGFAVNANGVTRFGAGDNQFQTVNNADNSGVMTYVSLRHTGALLGGSAAGNEMNGLSLYSVGSGTKIEHIELLAAGDDDIEYFGGTVNVKYISSFFGDDDKFDFDLGYKGKAQFLFALAADSLNSGDLQTSDNGFECDADDQFGVNKSTFPFQSSPQIWNATFISNGKVNARYDNTGHAGIMAKEMVAGSFRNCILANFRSGVHLSQARSNSVQKGDAYDQWTNGTPAYVGTWTTAGGAFPVAQSLTIKDNVIITSNDGKHFGFTKGNLVKLTGATTGTFQKDLTGSVLFNETPTAPSAADTLQFLTTDRNQIVTSVAGITLPLAFNGTNSLITTEVHAIPSTDLISASTPAADGFFTVVNYKGAFSASEKNGSWLSDSGLIAMKSLTNANPTDINQDGITNIDDFALLIGKYGQLDK